MDLPLEIASEIKRRIDHYRVHTPGALSRDGMALRVDGSIGYDCWMSPDGDVYMETYEIDNEAAPIIDRSPRAQLLVLTLGARTLPGLHLLMPPRPEAVTDCGECTGKGRFSFCDRRFICFRCCGRGWIDGIEGHATGAVMIAHADAVKAYRDLATYHIHVVLEADGWHVDYELKDQRMKGGGPHYVIDSTTGAMLSKRYDQ